MILKLGLKSRLCADHLKLLWIVTGKVKRTTNLMVPRGCIRSLIKRAVIGRTHGLTDHGRKLASDAKTAPDDRNISTRWKVVITEDRFRSIKKGEV